MYCSYLEIPTVKEFTLSYDAINEERTFSEGDCITGKVTMELSRETKIKSLSIKAKGMAMVFYSKKTSKTKYLKMKEYMIEKTSKGNVFPPGTHIFPFSIRIPQESMPSSFNGSNGNIFYILEAKLCRSWRMDRSVAQEIDFVSKWKENYNDPLMVPQVGAIDKDFICDFGDLTMDVHVDRMGYAPGETVRVRANVNNSTSKSVKPKLNLIRMEWFTAQGWSGINDETVCKLDGDTIPSKTQQTVDMELKIPTKQSLTIRTCDIITVEYILKVSLDISFHSNPKVKFPLVIIPVNYQPNLASDEAVGPNPSGIGGKPGCSDPSSPDPAFGTHPLATTCRTNAVP